MIEPAGPGMQPILVIEGAAIIDIPSFYAEINRVFMAAEDWQLGESLDALDDMLYGGYGMLQDKNTFRILWRDMKRSRHALGKECTLAYLREKLLRPDRFNRERIEAQIEALTRGDGQTYFDIIIEIFAGHTNLLLIAD
jgi:RNAse (barnase) inhibitor barstar